MKMLCPHCGTSFKVQESETVHHEKAKEYQEYEETVAGYEIESFVCPECSDMIVILRYGRLVPLGAHSYHMIKQEILTEKTIFPKTADMDLSDYVPEKYRKDYREAGLILPISPKASAAICRRMLQQILRDEFQIQKKDLYQEIEEFIQRQGVPSYIADSVDAVRNIGNFAAHPLKSKQTGEIMDVEDGEAEWLLNVLDALFDYTFVQPIKLQERQDSLNTKLRELGKGEMLKQ
ncbi:DUF4145 domain-containing protein [Paenibacillus sp. FSL R10-2199]|uniref:DUF4145 domain-containing protein n=1 Tax=Paenibacillus sp. FSL R10-2199 TaxID=2975348 RepID=UPI0030F4DA7F